MRSDQMPKPWPPVETDPAEVLRAFLNDLTAHTAPDFCSDAGVERARKRFPYGVTVGDIADANEAFAALRAERDKAVGERDALRRSEAQAMDAYEATCYERDALKAKLARVAGLQRWTVGCEFAEDGSPDVYHLTTTDGRYVLHSDLAAIFAESGG